MKWCKYPGDSHRSSLSLSRCLHRSLQGGLARTKASIGDAVQAEGMEVEFLHAGKAGSGTIAKRQYRVCVDFRVVKK